MQDLQVSRSEEETTFVFFPVRQHSGLYSQDTDKRRLQVSQQGVQTTQGASPSVGSSPTPRLASTAGQVVLEYILLLVVSVGVATVLTKQLVSRDPDSPGIITSAWGQINTAIASDIVD